MTNREDGAAGETYSWDFSLLYPPGTKPDLQSILRELDPTAKHDLGIDWIVAAFTNDKEQQKEIDKTLSLLIRDPDVISYRQDILEDLLPYPDLVARLETLFPVIDSLVRYAYRTREVADSLQEVIWRVGELQNVLDCIQGLGEIFSVMEGKLNSHGLCILKEEVRKIQANPTYQRLFKELPELLSQLRACVSITIGVNLDASLRPIQAVLLPVNDQPFTDQSLLNKLFGLRQDQEGIAPLHSVPQRTVEGYVPIPIVSDLGWAAEPMMVPLFADLAKVLKKTTAPVAKQLKQYTEVQGRMFVNLRRDLMFYIGAVRFITALQKQGLPVCRPKICPVEDRLADVCDSYNANLALHFMTQGGDSDSPAITANDIHIGPDGRIFILTGPNQGGKTTYMQGVGLVQLLAQVGCFVPGTQASLSPVDQIFTHFPLEEQPEADTGRFGEEASRFGKIFEQVTGNSLVLLNESLSSTSLGESLYLPQDVVRILRRLGARAIFSTHIHELAQRAGELNESVPGDSQIISVVSSPVDVDPQVTPFEVKRNFKVEIRPPLGQSYAREIAARYGISYQQLEKVLSERGVL